MNGGNSTCSPPVKSNPPVPPDHPHLSRESGIWARGRGSQRGSGPECHVPSAPRKPRKRHPLLTSPVSPDPGHDRGTLRGQMPGCARVAARRDAPRARSSVCPWLCGLWCALQAGQGTGFPGKGSSITEQGQGEASPPCG